LVVGGIVIMNIMLVSVTERTREIGVRKALGARRRDILTQFLAEASTLSLAGGLVGIGLGVVFALLIGLVSPLPSAVSVPSLFLGLAMSGLVGVFFGSYPAWRASRLDPIEALRYE
jgi:ABC-type antimicrobial peptide transport system permease subunit